MLFISPVKDHRRPGLRIRRRAIRKNRLVGKATQQRETPAQGLREMDLEPIVLRPLGDSCRRLVGIDDMRHRRRPDRDGGNPPPANRDGPRARPRSSPPAPVPRRSRPPRRRACHAPPPVTGSPPVQQVLRAIKPTGSRRLPARSIPTIWRARSDPTPPVARRPEETAEPREPAGHGCPLSANSPFRTFRNRFFAGLPIEFLHRIK